MEVRQRDQGRVAGEGKRSLLIGQRADGRTRFANSLYQDKWALAHGISDLRLSRRIARGAPGYFSGRLSYIAGNEPIVGRRS